MDSNCDLHAETAHKHSPDLDQSAYTEKQVAVIKDGVEQIKLTAEISVSGTSMKRWDLLAFAAGYLVQEARYFGERALLTNEGRAATIKVGLFALAVVSHALGFGLHFGTTSYHHRETGSRLARVARS